MAPEAAAATTRSLRKGSLVKVKRQAYLASVELAASDADPPTYIFEGPGQILLLRGDAANVRWSLPVPDVWLPLTLLEAFRA
ncbi:MAG: NAD(P)H-quinone oxidoreductase [Aphanocapsa feldmannii 277cV]|uniref:NDH-1 subunit O n=2 Tax=Aphanocapsa feldmannii TaxID=192050 RepID=A0A524RNN4_9CHRO|nr:MAG: NAD(P)H-quinone oxidoreductase [Aphanocapsa feldmannii 288cV]TGG92664.1 MAG: NAD(P)H-quinone oxidoreductase [Aphanocapsa feldmannii 277cV]TGH20957.1 MAG: NAD(P)H-quinone oxidoreductase [Aphanocapsa feldmannii 277cI]